MEDTCRDFASRGSVTWTKVHGSHRVRGKDHHEAIWLRQTYQVPETLDGYDLTGSRIWFDFHSQTNGPVPQIIYFNGRRVAMAKTGTDHSA